MNETRRKRWAEQRIKASNLNEEQYQRKIGYIYSLVHRIIERQKDAQYQPPHWDHEPTAEEKDHEQEYLQSCEDASDDCKVLGLELISVLFNDEDLSDWK